MTNFSIQPPTSLSLDVDRDGDLELVRQGTFNVTEATAFYTDEDGETIVSEAIIDSTVPPVSISATIGSGNEIDLFKYPKETEVLRVVGFFDPITVDGRVGNGGNTDYSKFDMLVGEYDQGIDPSTIYLPKFVEFAGYQITDLGIRDPEINPQVLDNNIDVFSETRPVLAMSPGASELNGLDVLELDNGIDQWYVGYTSIPAGDFALHGTTRGLGGGGFGDPHMVTFDQLKYDFHAAGEFTLVESKDDDFEVQVRAEHLTNRSTYFTAAATEVDGQRVAIYANQGDSLLVDGNVSELASGESLQVGDGLITRDQDTYTVTYDNNDSNSDPDQLVVTLKEQKNSDNQFLNVETFLSGEREDSVVGLLGNNNGIKGDDLALKDGTVLSEPIDFEQVYTEFADGWRIAQADSLFDYAEGEDTSTFTENNFFDNDNVISGLYSDDIINGGAGDDKIIGQGGADTLTGGAGMDTFVYESFKSSVLANYDTITDLQVGTDKIDGANAVDASEVVQLGSIDALDEASIQAALTESEFITYGAATFTYDSQTFLALNDEVAGYLAADDALIEITGFVGSIDDLAIV